MDHVDHRQLCNLEPMELTSFVSNVRQMGEFIHCAVPVSMTAH